MSYEEIRVDESATLPKVRRSILFFRQPVELDFTVAFDIVLYLFVVILHEFVYLVQKLWTLLICPFSNVTS
ncbi:hypothetical protein IC575_025189 [Cucumis melo]